MGSWSFSQELTQFRSNFKSWAISVPCLALALHVGCESLNVFITLRCNIRLGPQLMLKDKWARTVNSCVFLDQLLDLPRDDRHLGVQDLASIFLD